MRQFSIRSLMFCIVVAAFSSLALRNVRYWWGGMLPLMAGVALEIAILVALLLRGRHRALWVGFALTVAGYLGIALHPWLSPDLGTTIVLRCACATLAPGALESFERVGHGLFALLFGLAGGKIVLWFYARHEADLERAVNLANQAAAQRGQERDA